MKTKFFCKVHQGETETTGSCHDERYVDTGVCQSCDFDLDKWRMRNDPETIRVDGGHWRIGSYIAVDPLADETLEQTIERAKDIAQKAPNKNWLGCGGSFHAIQFFDGRLVFTNDLWGQGDISELVRHLLPDNARFVELAQ